MADIKRKGARLISQIPEDILRQLNQGEIETANLVEWLAVDQRKLLDHVLVQNHRKMYLQPVLEHLDGLKKQTVNTVNEAIGTALLKEVRTHDDSGFLLVLSAHQADMVRSWVTFAIGKDTALTIKQMLQKIRPFAADRHFNVREEAWVAVRPKLAQHLEEGIAVLSEWAGSRNENLRRFASEITRPRGVWCKHIEALKQNPELALAILEPLKADQSKYVRDSVGNWLNDASKTQPDFVKKLCQRWEAESPGKETSYIVKKAMRTINKIHED